MDNNDELTLSELIDMSESETQRAIMGAWLRKDQLAKIWNIDVRTVDRLVESGQLLSTKIRGCRRISAVDAARYLACELRKDAEKV